MPPWSTMVHHGPLAMLSRASQVVAIFATALDHLRRRRGSISAAKHAEFHGMSTLNIIKPNQIWINSTRKTQSSHFTHENPEIMNIKFKHAFHSFVKQEFICNCSTNAHDITNDNSVQLECQSLYRATIRT